MFCSQLDSALSFNNVFNIVDDHSAFSASCLFCICVVRILTITRIITDLVPVDSLTHSMMMWWYNGQHYYHYNI